MPDARSAIPGIVSITSRLGVHVAARARAEYTFRDMQSLRKPARTAGIASISAAVALAVSLAAAGAGSAAAKTPRSAVSAQVTAAAAPAYFHTVPPGPRLPTGAQCATWVRARPVQGEQGRQPAVQPDHRPAGRRDVLLRRRGRQRIDDRAADQRQLHRPTEQILRWAACKWGIDQNIVFAQAAVESWWRQDDQGRLGTEPRLPARARARRGRPGPASARRARHPAEPLPVREVGLARHRERRPR